LNYTRKVLIYYQSRRDNQAKTCICENLTHKMSLYPNVAL